MLKNNFIFVRQSFVFLFDDQLYFRSKKVSFLFKNNFIFVRKSLHFCFKVQKRGDEPEKGFQLQTFCSFINLVLKQNFLKPFKVFQQKIKNLNSTMKWDERLFLGNGNSISLVGRTRFRIIWKQKKIRKKEKKWNENSSIKCLISTMKYDTSV